MLKRNRKLLLALIGLFLAFVFLDSMAVFDSKQWFEIPHGSHSHYMPKNYEECTPPMEVGQGPTRRPGDKDTIDCQGNIIPATVSQ